MQGLPKFPVLFIAAGLLESHIKVRITTLVHSFIHMGFGFDILNDLTSAVADDIRLSVVSKNWRPTL